ncbi:MAG: RsmD family RNA methyltransferase [Sphingobacteriaceae bacterium]|nr:RsmD family RNA methyltransferase [Sphingobacteriaceae bacterium]
MRIIGGAFHGKILKVPSGLPVRPTTDFAKEALFNILSNKISFDEIKVLDLFCGTGHISYEFASRGVKQITCVDQSIKCCGYVKSISKELNFNLSVVKADVFSFLSSNSYPYDLIFADPPYDLKDIAQIHASVFNRNLLNPGGYLIIEHGAKTNLETLTYFLEKRKYGNVNFSFFKKNSEQ